MGWAVSVSAVALLAIGTAHAQFTNSPNSSHSAAVSATESSSTDYLAFAGGGEGTPFAALPAAPSPASGGAGGQYDNNGGGHHGGILSRMAFEAGGGFNAPASDSGSYITWGGNFTLGAGLHFSRGVSLLAEYQFMDDKLPGAIIAETGADGGNAHIWSFTLSPVVDLFPKRTNSVYITGGGGFYRKVTNFTDPEPTEYCDYYYCGIGYVNTVVGHFSSNQGGWNIGGGFTHRLGGMYGDGKAQLFAEARFLDVLTPAVNNNALGVTSIAEDTKLVPVTFGIRF